jgi:small subunit ribosomal protein S15
MINAEQTASTIAQFQRKPGDTGSPEVQVALLTKKIEALQPHFETHKKDVHSRMGLLACVNKRRRLLKYLKTTNLDAYRDLVKTLGLREGNVK